MKYLKLFLIILASMLLAFCNTAPLWQMFYRVGDMITLADALSESVPFVIIGVLLAWWLDLLK